MKTFIKSVSNVIVHRAPQADEIHILIQKHTLFIQRAGLTTRTRADKMKLEICEALSATMTCDTFWDIPLRAGVSHFVVTSLSSHWTFALNY